MMEFWTNHALNRTWRQFGYINHAWHLGFKDDMFHTKTIKRMPLID